MGKEGEGRTGVEFESREGERRRLWHLCEVKATICLSCQEGAVVIRKNALEVAGMVPL